MQTIIIPHAKCIGKDLMTGLQPADFTGIVLSEAQVPVKESASSHRQCAR